MKPITQDEEFLVRQIVLKLWQLRIISTKEFLKFIARAMRRPKKDKADARLILTIVSMGDFAAHIYCHSAGTNRYRIYYFKNNRKLTCGSTSTHLAAMECAKNWILVRNPPGSITVRDVPQVEAANAKV